MPNITVVDPCGGPRANTTRALAPRLQRTEGLTLGLVCNGLGNSATFFAELGRLLQERAGFARVVTVVKESKSVPPTDAQWAELADVDVAVTGYGGCGSCSTRAARDALELEWQGTPTVYVGHPALQPAVAAICKLAGHPDFPQVLGRLDPPVATWSDEDARALAADVAPHVHRAMCDPFVMEARALTAVTQ
jgi:hypothetical protein